MYRVSDLLSKPLITLADAHYQGTVGNIYFDAKLRRGKYIELFDEEETEQAFVGLNQVNFGVDAVVVKHDGVLTYSWNTALDGLAQNPINSLAFNPEGKSLGRVTDVLMEGTTVTGFEVDGVVMPTETLLSYSKNMLIFNDTGKPIKLAKPKKRVPPPSAGTATVAVTTPEPPKAAPQIPLPEKLRAPVSTPPPQATPYSFLVGKSVTADILDANGQIAVPMGTIVTPEVIDRARAVGRLVQLALHTR